VTAPKLLILIFIALLVFDYEYNNGRLIDALSDQAAQIGYWLNIELSNIERRLVPFH
jgi:hypothetical protein